jgi:SAM-dependent methyltransferase
MSRWILKALCHDRTGSMLDLACGAGEAVRLFRGAGWRVVGLDRSAAMLELARARNGGEGTFHQATMQDSPNVGSDFDLVTCMYDAVNCNLRMTDLVATFRNVYRLLVPGGRFVFDAFSVGGLYRAYDGLELHTRNRDHIVLTSAWVDRRRQVGTKELLGASRLPDWTPWREVHHVRAYPPKVLIDRLTQLGFSSVTMYGWPGGHVVLPGEAEELDRFVVVAQRRGVPQNG